MGSNYGPYERYLATNTLGLIHANIVYEKLEKSYLGCYSGFAGNVMQLKYFYINENNQILITDDETEIDPKVIGNDLERCYSLQKQRAEFESYEEDDDEDGSIWSDKGKTFAKSGTKDDERHMLMAKSKSFNEEIIYLLQDEWSLQYFIEKREG
tara:strand:+ start:43 stop:504 length:462 start_codon:yes stop_codon:yes gene_type:complete